MKNRKLIVNLDSSFFKPFLTENIQVFFNKEPDEYQKGIFEKGEIVEFLGEIKNSPGHGIFLKSNGQIKSMYDLCDFSVELEANVVEMENGEVHLEDWKFEEETFE
jgi:hypothetical protein